MSRRRVAIAASVFAVLPLFIAQACGPDFYPDVFVQRMRPDHPKGFAEGKLGILLPTFPRADLVVAFRYLNGGQLSSDELKAYQPMYGYSDPEWLENWKREQPEEQKSVNPVDSWKDSRAKYAAPIPKVDQERRVKVQLVGGGNYTDSYLNCNVDGFRNAVLTLETRAKTWGAKSAELADWIKGQDAVFANCAGDAPVVPADVPEGSVALLKADRAYQVAAAEFYGTKFEEARLAFEAIAKDPASPWHGIAGYLAARCLVRSAFHVKDGGDYGSVAQFDEPLMRKAAAQLESLLKDQPSGISRHAIQSELDLVRIRLEPMVRLRELSVALAGPAVDPEYSQHLKDLTWYLDANLDQLKVREETVDEVRRTVQTEGDAYSQAWRSLESLRGSAELIDWLIAFQSPAKEARDHAFAQWKKTGRVYWLAAALVKARGNEGETADLLKNAEKISSDSPAWEMVNYHRVRLLIATGRAKEARVLLAQLLPQVQSSGRDSSLNLFLELRARAAASVNEFLTYAPRKIIDRSSEEQSALDECSNVMKDPSRKYDCKTDNHAMEFSADAAEFFNNQASLDLLIDTAKSETLPEHLRRSIAITAWARAVLLKNDDAAAKMFPLLPEKLKQQSGAGTGFRPLIAIVRNPGLRPFLDAGVQRSYSWDFVESFGDNWWCQNWQAHQFTTNGSSTPSTYLSFLTPAQESEAKSESAKLGKQESAEILLGEQVVSYVKSHPNAPNAPESLYLVLRLIRYGCDRTYEYSQDEKGHTARLKAVKSEAARLLRQRYVSSPWTKKAAPFVG